jgi:hypothetical protein
MESAIHIPLSYSDHKSAIVCIPRQVWQQKQKFKEDLMMDCKRHGILQIKGVQSQEDLMMDCKRHGILQIKGVKSHNTRSHLFQFLHILYM